MLPSETELRFALQSALEKTAEAALEIILTRTAAGKAIDGSTFAPYSPGYAKRKSQAGKATRPPDLSVSGELLNALQVLEVRDGQATLGFQGQHRRTALPSPRRRKSRPPTAPKATAWSELVPALNAKRPFLGIGPQEKEQLARVFEEELGRMLRSSRPGT